MTTVGVQELAEHAAEYIRRVRAGETIVVTDDGAPVAQLTPVPEAQPQSWLERMRAEGRVTEATGSIKDLEPPPKLPPGERPLSEILLEMRENERA